SCGGFERDMGPSETRLLDLQWVSFRTRSRSRFGAIFRGMKPYLALLAALATVPGCATSSGGVVEPDRAAFLSRFEKALEERDEPALSALGDWSAFGRKRPDGASLTLPPGPFGRERELSATEVVYRDRDGRSWRALLRDAGAEGWRYVVRARPC